jgi:uncharacterized membrane protein
VDALRGLIMMIMAIDHASAFIARQHASEFWAGAMSAYTSAFPFLTRWITHLCAPGFFFLMGAGIYWAAARRRAAGVTDGSIFRWTALRGTVIFLCGQVFETGILRLEPLLKPAKMSLNRITAPPPNDGTSVIVGFIVLSGLGLVMIVCGLLVRFGPAVWAVVCAVCLFATNSLLPASGKPGPWWQAVLLSAGISQHVAAIYPVVPWLAAAAAGMIFGYWWRSDPPAAARRVWLPGLLLLATGLALRAAHGWGNLRLPRDGGWIEFLNNVKYPPSLVYLSIEIGLDLLLLGLLVRLPAVWKAEQSPLMVFGQTPLFFYAAHLYLFFACALVFFRDASSLAGMYMVWLSGLALLYPVCFWYRNFKMSQPPDSFWRLF